MTLTSQFQPAHYDYGLPTLTAEDRERLTLLNRIAALVPVAETDPVPPAALRTAVEGEKSIRQETKFDAATLAAFKTLMNALDGMTYMDGNRNVCLHGDVQNKMFEAFSDFNKSIVRGNSPLILTCEGSRHYAACAVSRKNYRDMVNGNECGASTYRVTAFAR